MEFKCEVCNIIFNSRPSIRKRNKHNFCSVKCNYEFRKRPKDVNHKIKHSMGYILVYEKNHLNKHKSSNQIFQHRLVASKKIGRPLTDKEDVHHINHIKTDNRPENLMVVDSETHARLEKGWILKNNNWIKPCSRCKQMLEVNKENFYFRNLTNKPTYLCKKCSNKRVWELILLRRKCYN